MSKLRVSSKFITKKLHDLKFVQRMGCVDASCTPALEQASDVLFKQKSCFKATSTEDQLS